MTANDRFTDFYDRFTAYFSRCFGEDEERVQNSLCWAWHSWQQNWTPDEDEEELFQLATMFAAEKSKVSEVKRKSYRTYGGEAACSVDTVTRRDLERLSADLIDLAEDTEGTAAARRLDRTCRRVQTALAWLDSDERQVAALAMRGYSQTDTADRLGRSTRWVRYRYAALRQWLGGIVETRRTPEDSPLYVLLWRWVVAEGLRRTRPRYDGVERVYLEPCGLTSPYIPPTPTPSLDDQWATRPIFARWESYWGSWGG